jgi:hypothetical protein
MNHSKNHSYCNSEEAFYTSNFRSIKISNFFIVFKTIKSSKKSTLFKKKRGYLWQALKK